MIEQGGSGADLYTWFAGGTQICNGTVNAVYNSNDILDGVWNWPAQFVAPPPGRSASLQPGTASMTPPVGDIATIGFTAGGTASSKIRMQRVTGGTNFQAGDTADIYAVAIGRWF
ncbi:hypothetical protein ACFMPD_02665 [Sedimentitalea sp. HM32M-2]|uniref:hypothetical protein n=1 Tax=Sedimentitalea sp. HM32M-2 TaxID=3351566 RepID=UPI0036423CF2